MKIGSLVYLNGTNREVSGVIIGVDDIRADVLWDNGRKSTEWEQHVEVFYESR